MRRLSWIPCLISCLAVVAGGCSIVNDPSDHTRPPEQRDAGGGADAGVDAGDQVEDAGPPDGGPPIVAKEDFCETYAQAWCDAVVRCCSRVDTEPPSCVGDLVSLCEEQLGEVFTDSRVEYDPVVAAETLTEGQMLAEACATTTMQEWLTRRDGFLGAFDGTVAGGESCEPLGSSAEEQVVGLLMCASPNQACRSGAGSTTTCQARGGVGADCGRRLECEDGMRCVRSGTTILAGGMCASTGEPNGSPCILSDECESLLCVGSGWFTQGTCEMPTQDSVYCPAD